MTDTVSEMTAVAAELSAASSGGSQSPETADTTSQSQSNGDGSTLQSTETGNGQPTTQPAEGTKPSGPLPYERHEAILKNTREKYESQLRELEWAKSVPRDEVERARQLYQWADTDPVGFYEFFGRHLSQDERYAQHLRSQPGQQETQPVDLKPEPDVLLEDGRKVYSHEGLERLLDWKDRQTDARVNQRFGPLLEDKQRTEVIEASRSEARSILTDAKTWPGFSESMKDIQALMRTDGRVTLESAYRRVVVPKLQAEKTEARQRVRQEVLAELQSKPNASTTNPGSQTVNAPKSYKGMSTEDIMRSVAAELTTAR